jgi:hypothetical protein
MFRTNSLVRRPVAAFLSLAALAFDRPLFAQVTTATIVGNVSDSSGGPFPASAGPCGSRTPGTKSTGAGVPSLDDPWCRLPLQAGAAVSCTESPISNTGVLR